MDEINFKQVAQLLVNYVQGNLVPNPDVTKQVVELLTSYSDLTRAELDAIQNRPAENLRLISTVLQELAENSEKIKQIISQVVPQNVQPINKIERQINTQQYIENMQDMYIGVPKTNFKKQPSEQAKGINLNIFMSYRRRSSQGFVEAIAQILRTQTTGEVFVDTSSIEPGSFPSRLRQAIERCDVLLFAISEGTLDGLEKQDDWVRKELVYALEQKKLIVPILEEMVDFPTQDQLPSELHPLLEYTGQRFLYGQLDTGIQKLLKFIQRDL